jgi:hypothetical protein
MNKNELYQLLAKEEGRVESEKTKRIIITILFFAIVFFLIWYFWLSDKRPTGWEIIASFLVSLVFAGFHTWANLIVFSTLFTRAQSENRMLDSIRKQIAELEEQETKKDL